MLLSSMSLFLLKHEDDIIVGFNPVLTLYILDLGLFNKLNV